MKTVIISAHTDDAIFSLGDYIQTLEGEVVILSVFAGVPPDTVGMQKHLILREEHKKACDLLGVKFINLDFLDDVYEPRPPETELREAIIAAIPPFSHKILAPIGIHHPDHILLSKVMVKTGIVSKWYKDLPYAELYPEEAAKTINNLSGFSNYYRYFDPKGIKKQAIECYQSQIQNDHIMGELLVTEELYS